MDRFRLRVGIILILLVNTIFPAIITKTDSLLVRENAHIEKLLMLDVTNEAMEADSILVKATDNYICNFPILKLPFFTEDEIDSILLGKSDTGHVHDTSDVTGLHDMLAGKSDVGHDHDTRYPLKSLGWVRSGYTYEAMETDRNTLADGMYTYSWYSDALNRPADAVYGSALTFGNIDNKGKAQILAGWGTSGNYLAYRSLRDAVDPWTAYKRIYHEGYKPTWNDIGGDQSIINISGFNNDAGYLDALPSHDHDIRYYTKTNLQTNGQAYVHWENITNAPSFITGIDWSDIGGTQSSIDVSGFNNDAGYLTELPSHDHDGRYPLKSLGWVRSGYAYESMETDRNTLADGMYTYSWFSNALNRPAGCLYGSALTFGGSGSQGKAQLLIGWGSDYENYIGFRSLRDAVDPWSSIKRIYHEGYKPQWDDIGSKPTEFTPEDHNHSATNITSGTLSNDRLSFNPDYFVQGETIRRSYNYGASNPLDNNNVSAFYTLSPDDPSNPPISAYGIHINSANANGYGLDIIGKGNRNKILWSGIDGGTRQPWREIWHSGNLDTANIAKLDADNVFTGVNTFDDSVKIYRIKPVNSNTVHIDLGQDVKNYGAYFRHIDAPYGPGAISMNAKRAFDAWSDGRVQLIGDESMLIKGDTVHIQRNSTTTQIYMDSDNKVTIGKVRDTLLPLNYELHDTLVIGRKYGIGDLNFCGSDGPAIIGFSKDFQEVSSLAGNLTYDATKHNFNGDLSITADSIVYHNNPSIIHSEFENIGSNSQTLNPTKGVYICFGSTTGQEITLGTTGVENGQTVKILKASAYLAGVRYGEPNNYYWRSIGHFGAAEFIHYNGVWFCHGTEYNP